MTQPTIREIELSQLDTSAAGTAPLALDLPFVSSLKVNAILTLGGAEVTIGQLRALKKDEVLALDRKLEDLVELTVDGHVIARGVLVAVGDQFGFRVIEAPHG